MKEEIVAVMSYPFYDRYVIRVDRQLDRFHIPMVRTYSAKYSEPEKVRRLSERFIKLNGLIQDKLVESRIKRYSDLLGDNK